jgi:sister-chromatid-cohesion protein PDS5
MKIYFQDSIEDKLMVERLLNSCIVPYSLGAKEKMAQLYYAFTTFDDYSIMSLIEIMKNRVLLYQLMKSIIEHNEMAEKNPEMGAKLNEEISQVSAHLLDTAKGTDFMKVLLNLFKKNLNLKNYFKAFVNVNSSCAKTLQMIQLIFTNLNTLNATQMSMGKRLIERMSSLIIDRDCLESLIDLVEYKIKQKLTPEQRRMLRKRRNQSGDTGVKKANRRPG